MTKSRVPLMLGFAAVGAGGYYLYSAGGDPEAAKKQMKIDAEKAREKIPSADSAEKYGKDLGKEAGSTVDDAVARARAGDKQLPKYAQEGKDKLNAGLEKVNSGVDKVDRDLEKKAAETKGTVSGWFGGRK